jgi:hypothetical protein
MLSLAMSMKFDDRTSQGDPSNVSIAFATMGGVYSIGVEWFPQFQLGAIGPRAWWEVQVAEAVVSTDTVSTARPNRVMRIVGALLTWGAFSWALAEHAPNPKIAAIVGPLTMGGLLIRELFPAKILGMLGRVVWCVGWGFVIAAFDASDLSIVAVVLVIMGGVAMTYFGVGKKQSTIGDLLGRGMFGGGMIIFVYLLYYHTGLVDRS